MKLYYHQTDGGAEYLTDRYVRNPDGSKEGVFENAKYIVRIDGNIRKDAELIIPSKKKAEKCIRKLPTGTEGQDRKSYSDTQDRHNYTSE